MNGFHKCCLLVLIAILLSMLVIAMTNVEVPKKEMQTYLVVDKNKDIESHFNPFYRSGMSVGTDYYITFKNIKTNNVFVKDVHTASKFYSFQKGKKYRCERFFEDK